jgi:hypothetical protein
MFVIIFSNTTFFDPAGGHQVFCLYKNFKKFKVNCSALTFKLYAPRCLFNDAPPVLELICILCHLWDVAKFYVFTFEFQVFVQRNTWLWSTWSKYVVFAKITINKGCVRRNTWSYLCLFPTSSYSHFILLPQALYNNNWQRLVRSTAVPWTFKSLVRWLDHAVHVCWVKHVIFKMVNTKCECGHSERSALTCASLCLSVSSDSNYATGAVPHS